MRYCKSKLRNVCKILSTYILHNKHPIIGRCCCYYHIIVLQVLRHETVKKPKK